MIRKKGKNSDGTHVFSAKLIKVSESVDSCTVLHDNQVRWFHRDTDNKRWTPFNGYDSLNLEEAYKGLGNSPSTTCSWPAGLELSGSKGFVSNFGISDERQNALVPAKNVSVLCGIYDVDLSTRKCHPVYWLADKHQIRVIRGTWFKDIGGAYQPLEDDAMVVHLEQEYSKCFSEANFDGVESRPNVKDSYFLSSSIEQPASIPTASSAPSLLEISTSSTIEDNQRSTTSGPCTVTDAKRNSVLHTVKFPSCHVDFYSPDEMYLYQDSTSLYIRQKLGMQKVGTRLRRGYNELASPNDKPPDVTHLCFVVHGIGQKMGTHSITRCVAELRDSCSKLHAKYFSGSDYGDKRVEFLPVEWRSSLQLDGDLVESITPAHVRGLRSTLNSSAMDIMYYTSPIYRAEIIASLLSELNRLYSTFCARNPSFIARGGRVSIMAHSLGCVLIYDILTGWNQSVYDRMDEEDASAASEYSRLSAVHSVLPGKDELNTSFDLEESDEVTTTSDATSDSTVSFMRAANEEVNGSTPNAVPRKPHELRHVSRLLQQLEMAKAKVTRLKREWTSLLGAFSGASAMPSGPTGGSLPPATCTTGLLFKNNLQNFFCLGSPLPVFLVLRGVRPGTDVTQDSVLPRTICPRIFNIYHPADPVAYRLEPLILKHYTAVQPALISRADAAYNLNYDELPLVTMSGKEIGRQRLRSSNQASETSSEDVTNHCDDSLKQTPDPSLPNSDTHRSSITSLVLGFFSRSSAATSVSAAELCASEQLPGRETTVNAPTSRDCPNGDTETKTSCDNSRPAQQPPNGQTDGLDMTISNSSVMNDDSPSEDTTAQPEEDDFHPSEFTDFSRQLERRLDYQLRPSRYDNLYLSILSSHTGYWSNADVGMLILSQLLNDE